MLILCCNLLVEAAATVSLAMAVHDPLPGQSVSREEREEANIFASEVM